MQSQHEAKEFLVAAILAQASREGVELSGCEQWMLRFSEADPEFQVDPERVAEFERETTDQAYEAKVADLIRGAYEHDTRTDSEVRAVYQEARRTLSQGDHYLSVMVDQALGTAAQPHAPRVLTKVGTFLVLIPAAAFTALIASGLAWIIVTGQARTLHEALPFVGGFVLFAGILWYLIQLTIRGLRA